MLAGRERAGGNFGVGEGKELGVGEMDFSLST